MIYSESTPKDVGSIVTAYEQLRTHVLDGAIDGSHFGLVVLLREGIAAWIEQASTRPIPIARRATKDLASLGSLVSSEMHVEIARILATIAMAIPTEVEA